LAFVALTCGQVVVVPTVYSGPIESPAASPVPASNVRIPSSNYVLQWSATLITQVRSQNTPGNFGNSPLFNSTRLNALLHVSMHDTIQAFDRVFQQYQPNLPPPPKGANIQAAITGAAFTVFNFYFANNLLQNSKFVDIMLFQFALLEGNGVSLARITTGFTYGADIARALLNSRANDGYTVNTVFVPQTANGFFTPTPPNFPTPVGNNWGAVTPWGLPNPITFYFPPQAGNTFFTNTTRYIGDYLEVVGRGRETTNKGLSNVTRSPIETFIGVFFDNDNFGTTLPPGQYTGIAQEIGQQLQLNRGNFSRFLAYVGLTLANANIGAWAVKYTYQEWRPVSGIRAGDTDPFPQTVGDSAWFPLSVTSPAFPDYISGHGTFGYGFAQIITNFLGTTNHTFTIVSDSLPTVSATYNYIPNFAFDNALSRVYLGCHFRAAALDTQFVGVPIANQVFTLLQPL